MSPDQPTQQDEPDSTGSSAGPDEPDSHPIQVEVVYHTDVAGYDIEGWLKEQVGRAIGLCGVTRAELNLVVVADDEMARLHEQYTGVAGTTDVLTFDMAEDALPTEPSSMPITAIEGDIVLCLDEAKRQAADRGHEPRQEMLLYAVHGLMHLLGEDDHSEADYQRMHAREDALLEQMGFGPLFHGRDTAHDS